jgi:hypothetical protein
VHPELDQDRALGRQRRLEVDDLAVRPAPGLLGGEALDPLDEHPAVPGAVEDGHAAPAREHRPEAPEEVVPLLVVRRRRELRHPRVPRVELVDQPLDGAALAGGVPALEQHQQRRADLAAADLTAEQQPQVHQSFLGLRQLLLGVLLRQVPAEVHLRQAAHAPSRYSSTPCTTSTPVGPARLEVHRDGRRVSDAGRRLGNFACPRGVAPLR